MATFSTNQARQIYVAKEVKNTPSAVTAEGDIALGAPENADYIYFQYQGPETILRSDILKKDLITSVKLTHGNNIQKFLNEYEVTITITLLQVRSIF